MPGKATLQRRSNGSSTRSAQLWLLEREKPLERILRKAFFKSIPTSRGVYLMLDETERITYSGKTNNLPLAQFQLHGQGRGD